MSTVNLSVLARCDMFQCGVVPGLRMPREMAQKRSKTMSIFAVPSSLILPQLLSLAGALGAVFRWHSPGFPTYLKT